MRRTHINMAIGIAGMTLLAAGAMLYAITSPQVMLTRTLLVAGAVLLVAYGGLNIRAIMAFFSKRSSRYGANMAMMIVLFVCIVVIVQALSVNFELKGVNRLGVCLTTEGVGIFHARHLTCAKTLRFDSPCRGPVAPHPLTVKQNLVVNREPGRIAG
ncbi:MAG: hypothetical protein KAT30_09415, partial [Candidatus Krumholzibacteria bacterium]|nr:hypothetical protein [Candidatus Krumholzibacteria bacterium]